MVISINDELRFLALDWLGFGWAGSSVEFGISLANLPRAHGGCLGIKSVGVEVCEMPGGVDKQAMIPGYPIQPGELKHLSNQRKRKKNRFRQ